jgi:riboflavin synthase
MLEVFDAGKLYRLGFDEGSQACLGVPGYVAVIPVASREWWKKLAQENGCKAAVVVGWVGPKRKAPGAVDTYFTCFPSTRKR